MEQKIKVVIGDRLGKGQKVAKGVTEAGGEAILIPGMAADMKVGDVMHNQKADLGISFCGSGGAGALVASNKYGYKAEHHLRSIEGGVTALRKGARVLGFGFMDLEELGRRLVEEYKKIRKEERE
ncbi:MAG: glycine-rich SFCGS family protein [Firmicutes bacterium]|nr:glycine-rich SFCGS family protein [Bacillota bacterium]